MIIIFLINCWQHCSSIFYSLFCKQLTAFANYYPVLWLKNFHWKNCSNFYFEHLCRVSSFSLHPSNYSNWNLARISINWRLDKRYLLNIVLLLCENRRNWNRLRINGIGRVRLVWWTESWSRVDFLALLS